MEFEKYREKVERRYNKSIDGLRSHFISYLAVNIGLFIINMLTSGGYPWFLYVTGGWGIGMASHWGETVIANKDFKDIQKLYPMNDEELKSLKSYHKARKGFFLHLVSNSAVGIYLLMINLITSSGFLWSLIPIAAMGVGVASHWGSYTNKKRRNNFTKDYKPSADKDSDIKIQNVNITAAENLQASILEVIKDIKEKFKTFPDDLIPKIDRYVETITLLVKKEQDLNESLDSESKDSLLNEKSKIEDKISREESEELLMEYNNYLEDIIKHINTMNRLMEQRELLHIKISTSINSLKHLKLELVGLKSKTSMKDISVINDFDKKSTELALYYKDLLESYDELMS